MPRYVPRYVIGAAGGLALLGSAVAGLHVVSGDGAAAAASIQGSLPTDCARVSDTTACGDPAPVRPSGTLTRRTTSPYRDGVYDATGHYETPGGSETLGVTLTVQDGTVSGARVHVEASSPTARQFQDQFASRYAAQVVARKLSEVSVSRVAGASLTSVGFDRAVAAIRSHAHV